ncbi:hypothetical protein KW849_14360 [Pseudomonas sp. PDM26]|uniref:hypothetical protein n=1 Tax=Pseudomonas sp. PDM26 TaxID=2854766 RepID=UPI001C48D4A0|nr:hypothetical protein [Pseudomonas sp. PDM26]MBV7547471.1 hypothetical protein [Pseudomonas sp. PDM26]
MAIQLSDNGTINLKDQTALRAELLLMRKEARCVLHLFVEERQKLRSAERALGILDAKGQGQGLPRDDIFVYQSHLAQSRFIATRMSNLAVTLGAYGHRLIVLMDALSPILTRDQRLDLVGAQAKSLPGAGWTTASLVQLVTRYKAEDSSSCSRGEMGPLLACVLACRGELIVVPKEVRQATQIHSPILPSVASLMLVAAR